MRSGTSMGMIFLLLFVLPIIVSLILLAIKGGKVGKILSGIFLALFLFIFLWVFTFNVSHQVMPEPVVLRPSAIALEAPVPEIASVGTVWRDGVEDGLKAEVYSSKKAAVRGLARQLEDVLTTGAIAASLVNNDSEPGTVRILESEVEGDLVGELRSVLEEKLESEVIVGGVDSGDGVTISLAYVDTENVSVWKQKVNDPRIVNVVDGFVRESVGPHMHKGLITATVETVTGKEIESVQYSEKPWLTDTPGFMQFSGSDHWAVALSDDACMTEDQAVSQAMVKAGDMIMAKVLEGHLPTCPKREGGGISDQEIINCGFVSDKFTQSFYGKSGRIWRGAVLLDLSPERLKSLSPGAVVKRRVQSRIQRGISKSVASLGSVVLLICVICWFLKAATKRK